MPSMASCSRITAFWPTRAGCAIPINKGTVESAIQHTQATALKGRKFDSIEAQNACQGQPKFPQLCKLNFPHPVHESVVSSARTRPALSFSFSRYELPRIFSVTA